MPTVTTWQAEEGPRAGAGGTVVGPVCVFRRLCPTSGLTLTEVGLVAVALRFFTGAGEICLQPLLPLMYVVADAPATSASSAHNARVDFISFFFGGGERRARKEKETGTRRCPGELKADGWLGWGMGSRAFQGEDGSRADRR